MAYTEPILRLIREFAKLPGIGERTAERLTFHVLALPASEAQELAQAIRDVKERIRSCTTCYNISDQDPCEICSDRRRDPAVVCVVEQCKDLWTVEKSGVFRGVYHVLNGRLSPLDGIGPEHLTIAKLRERIRAGSIREVILATNPTAEGDATAYYLQKELSAAGVQVTRIARGLPAGSSLEFANRTMVQDAFQGRKEL